MFASIKNLFSANNTVVTVAAPKSKFKCGMKFRVVFVSPFFELEVATGGNGWQTVHTQEGTVLEKGVTIYPILRFTSFDDAVKYATEQLGLTVMKDTAWFGLYQSPPASYSNDVKPRVMEPQYIQEGKAVKPTQVRDTAHQVPAFAVYSKAANVNAMDAAAA